MEKFQTISLTFLAAEVTEHFADNNRYRAFAAFQRKENYHSYYQLCWAVLQDRELLSHVLFVNDILRIPPVKTHLLYFQKEFEALIGPGHQMDNFVKKSIGAFWGMVMKFSLKYQIQETVSISLGSCFGIRTASCYSQPEFPIHLVD